MSNKHNILFYSSNPADKLSQQILQELNKNDLLKEQYLTICVNSPNIKLPRMIVEKNEVPVIVTRGFDQPISGEAALSLIKEANSGKAGGLEYGDPNQASKVSEDHGILAAESGRTSYQQAFNEDWNSGAELDSRTVNSAFSPIDDGFQQNVIDTYEEKGKGTKGLKGQLNKKLSQLNEQRMHEVPQPLQKVSGPPQQNQFPQQFGGQRPPNPQQQHHQPMMGGRGDMRFPPPPTQNPLFPPPRQMSQQKNPSSNVPQLPNGFGNIQPNSRAGAASMGGSDFSSFDNAFSGSSLMGGPMQTTQFSGRQQGNNNKRNNNNVMAMGLPSGRGHGGTFGSMVNTSSF